MTNPAIPPPPKPPSEPPAVRSARVQWDAIENIVAMILATIALYLRLIGPEVWGPIVAAASFGAGVLRMAGVKRAGIVSAGLLLAGKWAGVALVHGARHLLVVLAVAATLMLGSCAHAGRIVRTIDVIARDLCEIWGTEQGAKLGMSPAAFCAVKENAAPFVDAALAAKHAAGATAGARLAR